METVLHAYCGLYCGACPILLQTLAGEGEQRCQGCKSAVNAEYCATCALKDCARQKGIAFCGECGELEGCAKMAKFAADTTWLNQRGVLVNLETIKHIGLATWLEEQGERWRCAACGRAYSWWHETCPQCGQAVMSCKMENEAREGGWTSLSKLW